MTTVPLPFVASARRHWRRAHIATRLGSAAIVVAIFGAAGAFAWQVYQAACSQGTSAWFLQRAHARYVARGATESIAREASKHGGWARLQRAMRNPASRDSLAARTIAALPPLPMPDGSALPAARAAKLTIHVASPAPAAAWDAPYASGILRAPFGDIAVDVQLTRTFANALNPYPFSWDRAQLLIALVTVSAGALAFLVLHARRERTTAQLRGEFVAHVSHELRTPLAQLRMAAETLRYGWARTPEDHTRLVTTLDVESRRLSQLVENVLSFSSAERSMLRLARVPVDLTEVAMHAVVAIESRIGAGAARVVVLAPAPCFVLGDRSALQQVVSNLVDNAVKYGPRGQQVTVRVDARPAAGERAGTVVLAVEDQGPGIDASDRERVFDPFVRVASGGETTGYGIGLAVVRHIARLHGADISIDDAPGGGARVTMMLAGTIGVVADAPAIESRLYAERA